MGSRIEYTDIGDLE